jgi:hypothetical protein
VDVGWVAVSCLTANVGALTTAALAPDMTNTASMAPVIKAILFILFPFGFYSWDTCGIFPVRVLPRDYITKTAGIQTAQKKGTKCPFEKNSLSDERESSFSAAPA